jgi:type III pantothenate kinase
MSSSLLLADIGNTYFHIYDGQCVEHLLHDEAISRYRDTPLKYICVNHSVQKEIEDIKEWQDISSLVHIEGEYDGMGVDRKALCLSCKNAVFVDAGSAITVDVVEQECYVGGIILPGLQAYIKSYADISSVLQIDLKKDVDLHRLPVTTKEQISYGIIASIKALIEKHKGSKQLYLTG